MSSRAGWAEYAQRTSAFIPWRPRCASNAESSPATAPDRRAVPRRSTMSPPPACDLEHRSSPAAGACRGHRAPHCPHPCRRDRVRGQLGAPADVDLVARARGDRTRSARAPTAAASFAGAARFCKSVIIRRVAVKCVRYNCWCCGARCSRAESKRSSASCQISVAMGPGSTRATPIRHGRSSIRSASANRLDGELGRAVRAGHRCRDAPVERGDEHDPPAARAQGG